MNTAPPAPGRPIVRALLVARVALGTSIAILGTALLLLVIGFFEMLSQGLASSTSECCARPPAAPHMLKFVYGTEFIACVAVGLGLVAFVKQRTQRWPTPGGRSVALGIGLAVVALGIAGLTHLLVR